MIYLNLTEGFNPLGAHDSECIDFESFTFNGGEPHIKILDKYDKEDVYVSIKINSFNDLGLLCVAMDALSQTRWLGKKYLYVPYFPAARQDRRMVYGEPLTIRVYADIINDMDFDQVKILDPHSDVTTALIDNVSVMSNASLVENVLHHSISKPFHIVSPDAGANKKIGALCKELNIGSYIRCDKERDISTGIITGFKAYTDDLEGKDCVIIDDICDGGGTFLGLADELKSKGAGDLYLIVSHGIFSRGFDSLCSKYKKIFTTDSIHKATTDAGPVPIENNKQKVQIIKLKTL